MSHSGLLIVADGFAEYSRVALLQICDFSWR